MIDVVKLVHKDWINDPNKPKCGKAFYESTIMSVVNYRPVPDIYFSKSASVQSLSDVNNHLTLINNKNPNPNPSWISDHIPSYKAVEKFLRNLGVINIGVKRSDNLILVNNLTGVLIKKNNHITSSITFGGNNFAKKTDDDAKNLLKATVRDISFFAYHLPVIERVDYLKSAPYIIKRNFYLCLYPIGDNYGYSNLTQ